MSAESPLIVRSFPVGVRTATLSISRPLSSRPLHMVCEWAPDRPKRLSIQELAQYRAGRDAALIEIAQKLGIHAAVIDL